MPTLGSPPRPGGGGVPPPATLSSPSAPRPAPTSDDEYDDDDDPGYVRDTVDGPGGDPALAAELARALAASSRDEGAVAMELYRAARAAAAAGGGPGGSSGDVTGGASPPSRGSLSAARVRGSGSATPRRDGGGGAVVRLAAPVLSSSSLSAMAGGGGGANSPGRPGLPRPPSAVSVGAGGDDAAPLQRQRSMDRRSPPPAWPPALAFGGGVTGSAAPPGSPPQPPTSPLGGGSPRSAASSPSPHGVGSEAPSSPGEDEAAVTAAGTPPPAAAARPPAVPPPATTPPPVSAFSFPVTLPDAPDAAPAAAVFGSWTSLRRAKSGGASSAWSLDAPTEGDSDDGDGGERRAAGGPARAGRRFVGGRRWAPGPVRSSRSMTAPDADSTALLGVGGGGGGATLAPAHSAPLAPPPPRRASPPPPSRFDAASFADTYEELNLRIVARRGRAGPEPARALALKANDVIAGRYIVLAPLGAPSAFAAAVSALDTKAATLVALKVVHNRKSALDAALDEIRVLRTVAAAAPRGDAGAVGCVRLLDFFYYREHLFLVTELLRANLHQVASARPPPRAGGVPSSSSSPPHPPYFTLPRVQHVARQLLRTLAFLHAHGIAHADVKPENVLLKSAATADIALIDFGSATFYASDPPSAYIQSRAYRAPEVVLGCGYDGRIDVWSVGCVVAELISGRVLFQSEGGGASLLARVTGIVGPPPPWMLRSGAAAHRFYTPSGALYERAPGAPARAALLRPKRTSLAARVRGADAGALAFLAALLMVDPTKRPSAADALAHPWLSVDYGGGSGFGTPAAPSPTASPPPGRVGAGFVVAD